MKDIEIYPSSWYYNACVQGFLEVLAWGLGENGPQIVEEQLLQDDGRVIIPGALAEVIFGDSSLPEPAGYDCVPVPEELGGMKRIAWWWVEYGYNLGYMRKDDREKRLSSSRVYQCEHGGRRRAQRSHFKRIQRQHQIYGLR